MSIKHVVSVSGGKDSLATLLIAIARFGRANIIAIFCDTGNEHELTYAYLEYLEATLQIRITRLRADFTAEIIAKRMFIARDARTRREYERRVMRTGAGDIVYKLANNGLPQLVMAWRDNGEFDLQGIPRTRKAGGQLVRWSNKAKRRAMQAMHPTGNPFLDLCLWKGRFPSRKAQFCTEELKRNMAVAFQLELEADGHTVVSWQGVRRDESFNRRAAKKFEHIGGRLYIFRPIVEWTAEQVFALAKAHGITPNPLYTQGMGRVGCMPCINVNKAELREISVRFAGHIERIAFWELLVGLASKRGFSTFMTDSHAAADRRVIFADLNIWSRVEWSKTTRGGRQYDLLFFDDAESGCSSSYGLCDKGDAS